MSKEGTFLKVTLNTQELMNKFADFVLSDLMVDENCDVGSDAFFQSVQIDPVEFARAFFDFNAELDYRQHIYLHLSICSYEQSYDEMDSQFIVMKKDLVTQTMQCLSLFSIQEIMWDGHGHFSGLKKNGLNKLFSVIADHFD